MEKPRLAVTNRFVRRRRRRPRRQRIGKQRIHHQRIERRRYDRRTIATGAKDHGIGDQNLVGRILQVRWQGEINRHGYLRRAWRIGAAQIAVAVYLALPSNLQDPADKILIANAVILGAGSDSTAIVTAALNPLVVNALLTNTLPPGPPPPPPPNKPVSNS